VYKKTTKKKKHLLTDLLYYKYYRRELRSLRTDVSSWNLFTGKGNFNIQFLRKPLYKTEVKLVTNWTQTDQLAIPTCP
jgi:hypothetical protein